MRLFSPQLTMPNLQPRSFQPVANIDTQREGGPVSKTASLNLTSKQKQVLENKYNLSYFRVINRAIQIAIYDGSVCTINSNKPLTSIDDIIEVLDSQLAKQMRKMNIEA
jgi:hypothetical protein